jgi:hypothetical protein
VKAVEDVIGVLYDLAKSQGLLKPEDNAGTLYEERPYLSMPTYKPRRTGLWSQQDIL